MKIGKFSLVAILSLLIVGIVCSVIIYSNINSFEKITKEYSTASNLILNADRDLYQALQAQYILLDAKPNTEDFTKAIDAYDENYGQVKERIDEALTLVKSPSIDSLANSYTSLLNQWHTSSLKLAELLKDTTQKAIALETFENVCLKEFKSLRGTIDEINGQIDLETVAFVEASTFNSYLGIGIFVVLIIITIFLLNFLSGKIKKPIGQLVKVASAMSKGDFSHAIQENQKGEVGELANTFITLKITIQSLSDEIEKINNAGESGQLDVRANSSKFSGVFANLIGGLNSTLDSIIKPLNVAAEYVDRISKGDIPPTINEEYKGDFNEIKNNLNQCISAINLLLKDTNKLVNETTLGHLDSRANIQFHSGDFKKVVNGINKTLDRLVGLIDNMPMPVQIVDKDYKILYLNKKAKDINL